MEKTFRAELNRFKKEDFKLWQIVVASEVDTYSLEITEGDFEVICSFCYDLVLDTDYDPNAIVKATISALESEQISIYDMCQFPDRVEELVLHDISTRV